MHFVVMKSAVAFGLVFLSFAFATAEETAPKVSFGKVIKPILRDKCAHCHNRKTLPDRGSFESAKLAFIKNKSGVPYFVPGKPDESLVVIALESPDSHANAMPMVGPKPTKEDIQLIRRWIAEGADWPKGLKGRIKPTFYAKE